jgi:hypothetical protein
MSLCYLLHSDCHSALFYYAELRYAECGVLNIIIPSVSMLNVIRICASRLLMPFSYVLLLVMLSGIMLSVTKLNVIMLSFAAEYHRLSVVTVSTIFLTVILLCVVTC